MGARYPTWRENRIVIVGMRALLSTIALAVMSAGCAPTIPSPAPSATIRPTGSPSAEPSPVSTLPSPSAAADLVEESVAGVTFLRPSAWQVFRYTSGRPGPITYASSIPMSAECLARGILMARSCLPGGRLPDGSVLLSAGAYGKAVNPLASPSLTPRKLTQPQCKAFGGTAYGVEVRGVDIWGCVKGAAGEASFRSVIASIR